MGDAFHELPVVDLPGLVVERAWHCGAMEIILFLFKVQYQLILVIAINQ